MRKRIVQVLAAVIAAGLLAVTACSHMPEDPEPTLHMWETSDDVSTCLESAEAESQMDENEENSSTFPLETTTSGPVDASSGPSSTASAPSATQRIDLPGGDPHTAFTSVLLDVPYLSQKDILPNGCEAVSATMLLHHVGDIIPPLDFVDRYLDCKPAWREGDVRYGPDPSEFYAGDPTTPTGGYGCFSPVIVKALNRALQSYAPGEYEAVDLSGISLEDLEGYIDCGIPVAVWATIGMKEVPFYYEWISPEDGQKYRYPSGEHCLVLVGYDENRYYFNDPYNSNGLVSHSKSTVEKRYETLGRQAVAILPMDWVMPEGLSASWEP